MIDVENKIFDTLSKALKKEFSGVYVSGETVETPAKYPAVTIIESDNKIHKKSQDNKSLENHADLMYEVNVYSNLQSGKKSQAKEIRDFISDEFLKIGFTRTFCQPIPNLQTASIYRITIRFTAVAGADGIVYTN